MTGTDPIYVLLIEDDPAQQRLMEEAFKECGRAVKIVCAATGAEALALLHRERPNIIILDLSLPAMDGREVLTTLKRDRRLNYIPIVVFTGSVAENDVVSAYSAGANSYIRKPGDFDGLVRCLAELLRFWTTTAILPPADYADRPRSRALPLWSR